MPQAAQCGRCGGSRSSGSISPVDPKPLHIQVLPNWEDCSEVLTSKPACTPEISITGKEAGLVEIGTDNHEHEAQRCRDQDNSRAEPHDSKSAWVIFIAQLGQCQKYGSIAIGRMTRLPGSLSHPADALCPQFS
jgi:hypothetical protein